MATLLVFLYYVAMGAKTETLTIGVVSDTHSKWPDGLIEAFEGVDMIIHAGDIGKRAILQKLRLIAPVHSVCGNMDSAWTSNGSPEVEWIPAGKHLLYVVHD